MKTKQEALIKAQECIEHMGYIVLSDDRISIDKNYEFYDFYLTTEKENETMSSIVINVLKRNDYTIGIFKILNNKIALTFYIRKNE